MQVYEQASQARRDQKGGHLERLPREPFRGTWLLVLYYTMCVVVVALLYSS